MSQNSQALKLKSVEMFRNTLCVYSQTDSWVLAVELTSTCNWTHKYLQYTVVLCHKLQMSATDVDVPPT